MLITKEIAIITILFYLMCSTLSIVYILLEDYKYNALKRQLIILFWWYYLTKFIIRRG